MTSTAYDIDENIVISGMHKLKGDKNVEISAGLYQRRWGKQLREGKKWEDYWRFFKKLRTDSLEQGTL